MSRLPSFDVDSHVVPVTGDAGDEVGAVVARVGAIDGVGARMGSGAGVVDVDPLSPSSGSRFSYQITRPLSRLAVTKSKSSSPSRSTAITWIKRWCRDEAFVETEKGSMKAKFQQR